MPASTKLHHAMGHDRKSFDALRQRVIKDLDKLKHIEACGVWMSDFDPLGENYDPDLEIAMSKIACLAS